MSTDTAADVVSTKQFENQYLTFSLGSESYAVDVLKVREIRSWSEPTPLPHAANHVLGVINLRGAVIPIIDLRRQFALSSSEYTSTTGVIVVQAVVQDSERQVGLVVDRVLNVCYLEIAQEDLTTSPDPTIGGRYVSGLSQSDEGLVIVVDLETLVEASLLSEPSESESEA